MAYAHASTVLVTFYYFIMPQDYLSERHLVTMHAIYAP